MAYENNTIKEYLQLLSSSSSTPSGGSALGLVLEIAASLGLMVTSLTKGKKGYEAHYSRIEELDKELALIKDKSEKLMNEDAISFSHFMEAYKSHDEEKIKEAAKASIEVPTNLLEESEKLIKIAEELILIGNKNVVSDAKIALGLAKAVIPGCKLNIEANLPYIKENEKYYKILGKHKKAENKYEEWKDLECIFDSENPYSACYLYDTNDKFFVEPVFHLQLQGMKQRHEEEFNKILEEMKRLVLKNHLVVFTGDDESSITKVEGAIYLTIQDVCDPLCIYVEDKTNRDSDWKD